MTANSKHGRTLRATLCEIERGLFYATYSSPTFESDTLELPTYGLGTCASHVKQRMEKSIHAFGYATVIWEDTLVLPQSHLRTRGPAVSVTQARPLSK
jgi:hypothetical protein